MAKKSVIAGDYIIEIADSGHVDVLRIPRNTKEALRRIAKQVGFRYDEKWNTQYFGSKLADYLIEHKAEADKVLRMPNRRLTK